MGRLIGTSQIKQIARQIAKVVDGLSDDVNKITVILPSTRQKCPDCGYNAFTQSGTDPNCRTCNGKGHVSINREVEILAVATTITSQIMEEKKFPARIEEGDTILLVSYEQLRTSSLSVEDLLTAKYRIKNPNTVTTGGTAVATRDAIWVPKGSNDQTCGIYNNLFVVLIYLGRQEEDA